ncbi:MAG: GNAT family N-acetyltransferase [Acidimicrobiales bacterium]
MGRLVSAAYEAVPGSVVGADYRDVLEDVADRARRAVVLVALDPDGYLLGGVTYAAGGGPFANLAHQNEAEIRMLAVSQESKRQGVGRGLVRACVQRAAAEGRHRLWLETASWTMEAQALYLGVGFKAVRDRNRTVVSSGLRVELRAYALDLSGQLPRLP